MGFFLIFLLSPFFFMEYDPTISIDLNGDYLNTEGCKKLSKQLKNKKFAHIERLYLRSKNYSLPISFPFPSHSLPIPFPLYPSHYSLPIHSPSFLENLINHEGIHFIAKRFNHLSKLKILALGKNDLQTKGVENLMKYIHHFNHNLEHLGMASNSISDNGLISLANHLKYLNNLNSLFLSSKANKRKRKLQLLLFIYYSSR